MRIGIISDVHGNYEALKSVLFELDRMGISEIYCLGDVAGYYCQVNECCEELISRGIPSLMGNHDWYLAGNGYCLRSKSVNDCIAFQRTIISKRNLEWLKGSQFQFDIFSIRMVHGGWSDPLDEYLVPSSEYFSRLDGEFFVSGHTHIQTAMVFGTKTYCNPGSVGQPRDLDPRAAFAIFEDGEFQLKRVEYDVEKISTLMKIAGFDDYYYGSLKSGAKNLRKL